MRWAWLVSAVTGAGAGVIVASVIRMPRVDELEQFTPSQITYLYDSQGQLLKTYAVERRVLLKEGELPRLLKDAVVAVEDANFFRHGGVDLQGVLGAAWDNVVASIRARSWRVVRGAGTLTMQLARELFFTRERTLERKIAEALMAVEIEKRYSKQQILTLYCNLVNLGHGNYGMEAGARYYFNKSVKDLTLAEAATLAGIPQRPNDYSPYRNPGLVVQRRNKVLRRMAEEGFITSEEMETAVAEPLLVTQHRPTQTETGAYFSEEVRRYLERRFGADRLYQAGLRVETTLDKLIQAAAEEALRQGLLHLDHRRGWRGPIYRLEDSSDLESRQLPSWTSEAPVVGNWHEGIVLDANDRRAVVKIGDRRYELMPGGIEWTRRRTPGTVLKRGDVAWFRLQEPQEGSGELQLVLEQEPEVEGAVVVLESATAAVRALVGGFDFERSKFDRATQARRQVGSAFKPFVYGAALESGFTPADTLFDAPVAFPGADNLDSYSPRNYYPRYYGITTLRRALEASINVTSVKLFDLVGATRVVGFARRCGIESDLPPYPSLALGAADLIPLEVAAAYASFANQGIFVKPYLIERVSGSDGELLEEHLPQASKATEPAIAYVLSRMLRGVVLRGTGSALRQVDLELAGKTGTTNDYGDAWFVGFTPRYTLLTWVGYDRKRSLGRGMTGAEAALPIWKDIVERGLEEGWLAAGARFAPPAGVVDVAVDRDSGLLAAPGASEVITVTFVAGTEPSQYYDEERGRILQLPWYQQRVFYLPKEGERMPEDVRDWDLVREAWEERSSNSAR